ncbi:FG-GAP-like repeat-containing protein [Novosphingobium sp. Chol11]|uniref:FG-GAP-like repeat-containing protein n=1 Tax=Novosphingobium sp. Chol11 TaxID=1385763 RepID=UPI0025F115E0|nr:FG-GAP-like repeat-containing protein [Novosphingobium sp. Chol11]
MAIIDGNSSSQSLPGGPEDDVITGFGGDDQLSGGGGSNVFAYPTRQFGDDVIVDFVQGQDRINLSVLGIADFATLLPFINETFGDSVIGFFYNGDFESITLRGVARSQLSASDFIFNASTAALTPVSTASDDLLFGGNGDDTVNGSGGDDTLVGGAGSDTLNGGAGFDRLIGGSGSDVFAYTVRQFDADVITDFVQGVDRINLVALGIADLATLAPFISQNGADSVISLVFGGENETITVKGVLPSQLAANDFIFNTSATALTPGSSGFEDLLFGGNGADSLSGGNGDDTLIGANGNDTLTGGQGDDKLIGGADSDTLIGGTGLDTLTGGAGNDIFNYNARRFDDDVITDFVQGEDRINLSAFGIADLATLLPFMFAMGADTVIQFYYEDLSESITITGVLPSELTAADFIFRTSSAALAPGATASTDYLFGGLGADTLNGGLGDDTLSGGSGSDTLIGGAGRDFLIGGAGADIFRGTAAEMNGDIIGDMAVGDRITFSGVSAPGSTPFTYSLSGITLTYTGGTLLFDSSLAGFRLVATANAAENGFDLSLQAESPPVISSDGGGAEATRSVAENTAAVTTVQAADPDAGTTLTYAIAGGADAARFQINATTGALSFRSAPNFEAPTDVGANNVYDVIVSASDGTLADTQAIAVTVTNVNETIRSVRNDFNGDGRSDLLWRNSNGQLSSWLGSANGALIDNGAVVNQLVPTAWRIQGTADFNGDGRADILWRNVNGQLSSWLGNPNGGFIDNGSVVNQFVPTAWKIAGTGDFNGDGRADIVWRNDNGQLSQWLGTANGGLSDNGAIVNQSVPTAWKIAGTGDFNNDGFSDVLWRNDNGQLSQWLGSANGRLIDNGVNVNQTVPTAWKIAGTGDFNGDGFSDVLWRNDNGRLSEWLGSANGRLIDNGVVVSQLVPLAWKIQGTGDFNGDGRADIAWRNDNGQLSEWLGTANGGFVDNGAVVNQFVPNAWTIHIQDYQLI